MLNKIKYNYHLLVDNLQDIWNGVSTAVVFVFLNKDKKAEIRRRRAICDQCTYMSRNYVKTGLYATNRKDSHCSLCGCNIYLKTASLTSNCGIEKLNQRTGSDIPLKWAAYKKPTNNGKN